MQLLHATVVAAPDQVRDQVRNLTRMQLIRTCASWRPDAVGFRDPVVATKISLRSIARRILDVNDEIADLDRLICPLVAELAPALLAAPGIGTPPRGPRGASEPSCWAEGWRDLGRACSWTLSGILRLETGRHAGSTEQIP